MVHYYSLAYIKVDLQQCSFDILHVVKRPNTNKNFWKIKDYYVLAIIKVWNIGYMALNINVLWMHFKLMGFKK